jgi:hypothetical protein
MALISCGECNKEVSDKAATCPNCGAPIQQVKEKHSLWDSLGQSSGPKEVVIRGTDTAYEGQKLGEGLIKMFMALFLHPIFSFVGFWLICTLTLGSTLGTVAGLDTNNLPTWFFISTMGISTVLAVLLRKIIPTMMKWILYILLGVLVLAFVGGVISAIIDRSTSS